MVHEAFSQWKTRIALVGQCIYMSTRCVRIVTIYSMINTTKSRCTSSRKVACVYQDVASSQQDLRGNAETGTGMGLRDRTEIDI